MEGQQAEAYQGENGIMEVKNELTAELMDYLTGAALPNRSEYLFFLGASILFSLVILVVLSYTYLWPLWTKVSSIITDKERICGMLRFTGSWGPLVFILLEAAQCVTIFWPVPVEIAGGFLFGLPLGLFYSTVGLTLGSIAAFYLGDWLGRRYLPQTLGPERMKKFQKVMRREGALTAFLIYLIPGVPKDFVSYFLGATGMSLPFFVVASTLFRLPTTLLLNLQGVAAGSGSYLITGAFVALNFLLAGLIYRSREYIYRLINRWHPENNL